MKKLCTTIKWDLYTKSFGILKYTKPKIGDVTVEYFVIDALLYSIIKTTISKSYNVSNRYMCIAATAGKFNNIQRFKRSTTSA